MCHVAYDNAGREKKKNKHKHLEESSEERRELMYLPHVACVNFPTCKHVTFVPEDRGKYRVKAISLSKLKSHESKKERLQEIKF